MEPHSLTGNESTHPRKSPIPVVRSRIGRGLLIVAGTLCVALGLLGIILPLLPTTPFLLLAGYCYLRSSERLYHWLHTNRLFGEYLRRYRDGEGIPLASKITAITILWLTLGSSVWLFIPDRLAWVRFLLVAIGAVVTVHILRLPTRR